MKHLSNASPTIREIDAPPQAAALIEGHRDFGYSLETALADIIDNSITAQASEINLVADTTSESPWIVVADNGCGMSEDELIQAMRLGSKNPTAKRETKDLGRFGLGLKSASFSQCRSLTVITRNRAEVSCARWDMDRIAERNDWSLEIIDYPETIVGYNLLPDSGTVIVWEKLDRLSGGFGEDSKKRIRHLNSEIVGAERHLRLVFHRFIEGASPQIKLLLNDRRLEPIDPMASNHPATQKDPDETLRLNNGAVCIRCHTLPHHKNMTMEDWNEIGGPEGHMKTQGLYVYRENRLIISGGWLGLTRQTELTKLCRIAVDIPNTMDSEWKIDVKKASAQLPPLVRERLKKIVERFIGTSKRTYTRRGRKLVDESRYPLWNRVKKDSQIIYRPNYQHPVFRAFSGKLPENLREGFDRCLRLVGSGLPLESLYAELIGNSESITSDKTEDGDLKELVFSLASFMIDNGTNEDQLSEILYNHTMLSKNWESVSKYIDDFRKGNKS